MDDDFEQILWDDWVNGYWVETISQYEPILFMRVGKKHMNPDKEQPKGREIFHTAYTKGEDGFVYKRRFVKRVGETLIPIYTLKKAIG